MKTSYQPPSSRLHERVLLEHLRATPAGREWLRAASLPDDAKPEAHALQSLLDGGAATTRARLVQQADALRDALPGGSAHARGLRGLHASLRGAVRARLRELGDLQYRLLADHLAGRPLRGSQHWRALCEKRAELRVWLDRSGQLARRAGALRSDAEARRLLWQGIEQARAWGLGARRARLWAWLGELDAAASLAPLRAAARPVCPA